MKTVLYVLLAVCVVTLGFWAYHENYKTQDAMAEAEAVQTRIGDARARLAVLRAEWAYLNRPDRLRDLAEINFDALALLPLQPEQFGRVDEIPYPPVQTQLPLIDPATSEAITVEEGSL